MFDSYLDDDGNVILSGRLDAAQVQQADAVFDRVNGSTRVDLSGLEYISSAGIAVLLRAYKRLDDEGHTLTLTNLSQRILTVLHYAGLDTLFTIE